MNAFEACGGDGHDFRRLRLLSDRRPHRCTITLNARVDGDLPPRYTRKPPISLAIRPKEVCVR